MKSRRAIWIAGVILLGAVALLFAVLSKRSTPRTDPYALLPELDHLEPPLAQRLREVAAEVEANPRAAEAWGRLGAVLHVHDLDSEAIPAYEQAQALDPGELVWPYSLGLCKWVGDREGAMAHFRQASRLDPDYPPLRVYLGIGHLEAGELDRAEASFRRAVELDSTLIRAHIGLARVALDRAHASAALDHVQTALALGPEAGEVHWLLAEVQRRLGDDAAAARHAELAQDRSKLEPLPDPVRDALSRNEGVTVHWRRARSEAYRREGRLDRVLVEWQEAASLDPDSANVQFELGLALAETGRLDEAEAHYRLAIDLRPDFAKAHQNLGTALAGQDRVEEAIAALERALEADPSLHEAHYNLGGLLVSRMRTREGVEHLRQAAEGLPGRADVQFSIAMTLASLGHTDEALAAFERALAADPDHVRVRFEYGVLLARQGRLHEAAEAFEKVAEAAPDRVNVHANLIRALKETGQHAKAIEACRRALVHFPGNERFRHELAWMLATRPDP